jgi:hypothetical protein
MPKIKYQEIKLSEKSLALIFCYTTMHDTQ